MLPISDNKTYKPTNAIFINETTLISQQRTQKGFTLIELMIVISIIGIMASLAIPEYQKRIQSEKITNAVKLTNSLKTYVDTYYQQNQRFPADNETAGLPPADKLLSPEVIGVEVVDGAFHISLAESTHASLKDRTISVRPVYVVGSPKSPISWICGNAIVPKGMTASGSNKTNIPYTFLPIECRDITGATARMQSKQKKQKTLNEEKNNLTESDSNENNNEATDGVANNE